MSVKRAISKLLLPAIALVCALVAVAIAVVRLVHPSDGDNLGLVTWALLSASGVLMFVSYMTAPSRPPRER